MANVDLDKAISDFLFYAERHLGMKEEDEIYLVNLLLGRLGATSFSKRDLTAREREKIAAATCPDFFMTPFVAFAKEKGDLSAGEEEFFTSEILDMFSPRPSETREKFRHDYAGKGAEKAFDGLYDLGVKNDYVKLSAIAKNKCWVAENTAGKIEITINLSKPEKNNRLTAKLRNVSAGYPACMLCRENVGYEGQGRTRRNMRTVPLRLAGEDWFWQFSPYAYFYQHGIAVNEKHVPMSLTKDTFVKLFDFVDFAPQYFIGSNAPLPIVGGSILAHEHFQGGKHFFPMFAAPTGKKVGVLSGADVFLPDWYNSVILLKGEDREAIVAAAARVLAVWEKYSDESVEIVAYTDAPHNTLAPIARKEGEIYFLYLLLRNNRCDEEQPDGIFHAHKEYHNIKSESIGLIEAMGRFILPGRLDRQLKETEKFLTGERTEFSEDMEIHRDMILSLQREYGSSLTEEAAHAAVVGRVEKVCENILDNTAVFKRDEKGRAAFFRFLSACGLA